MAGSWRCCHVRVPTRMWKACSTHQDKQEQWRIDGKYKTTRSCMEDARVPTSLCRAPSCSKLAKILVKLVLSRCLLTLRRNNRSVQHPRWFELAPILARRTCGAMRTSANVRGNDIRELYEWPWKRREIVRRTRNGTSWKFKDGGVGFTCSFRVHMPLVLLKSAVLNTSSRSIHVCCHDHPPPNNRDGPLLDASSQSSHARS